MAYENLLGTVARAVLAAGLLAGGQIACAQDVAGSQGEGEGLEDIIVTARKVQERLQDAPVAVTTVTGDKLDERGIRNLSETMKLASSLKLDSDADVRAGVAIRGVGQSGDVNVAPGVGMFIDGVYQPSAAYYTVPFFDTQRIEILKGPQGTLYGKNTMGGAISIISREPGDVLGMNFSVEASSGSQIVAIASVDMPISEGFGNRTSVFYRYSKGLLPNRTLGGKADGRRDFAARTRFVLNSDSKFKSSLSMFYADLQAEPLSYSATTLGLNEAINNVTKNINGLTVSRYKSVNFTNSLDLGAATITSLTSYDKGNVSTLIDGDFVARSLLRVTGTSSRNTFAQEFRVASSDDGNSNFRWLVGAYYSDDRVRSNSLNEINVGVFRPQAAGIKRESGKTYAGFGQVTLILDKLELVAGLRYDDESRANVSSTVNSFPVAYTSNFNAKVTSKAWQPKVSASYHFTPDIMAYALVSRGFRAGGFNPITAPAGRTSYRPERTTNYEGGLKTELFGRRIRLNSAFFYTDYTDILLTDQVPGTDSRPVILSRNGGKARSFGFELDAAVRVTSQLTLNGGYTYLNIKNDVIPTGGIRREVTGFAPHVFNVQADYNRNLSEDVTLGAHISASYIGRTPMANEVTWRKAHLTSDASLDLRFRNVTLSAFGKNIFNEKYYTSYLPASATPLGALAPSLATPLGLLNRPAEYGVRLSGKF